MNNSIRWEPVEDGEYDMGIVEYPLYIFGNTDPDVCTHIELYDEEVMLDLGMTICIAKPAPALEIPEEVRETIAGALQFCLEEIRQRAKVYLYAEEAYPMLEIRIAQAKAWLEAQRTEETTND